MNIEYKMSLSKEKVVLILLLLLSVTSSIVYALSQTSPIENCPPCSIPNALHGRLQDSLINSTGLDALDRLILPNLDSDPSLKKAYIVSQEKVNDQWIGTWTDVTNDYNLELSDWDTADRNVISGDYNNDGCDDLLIQQKFATDDETMLLISTSSGNKCTGFNQAVDITGIHGTNGDYWNEIGRNIVVGDFNGDGKDDLILQQQYYASYMNTYLLIANGSANNDYFNAPIQITNINGMNGHYWKNDARNLVVGDYNGDGNDDLILQQRDYNQYTNTYLLVANGSAGSNYFNAPIKITNSYGATGHHWKKEARTLIPGDFNGDDCDDLFLQQTKANINTFILMANKQGSLCDGFTTIQTITNIHGMTGNDWMDSAWEISVTQYNDDGKDDLVLQDETSLLMNILLGNGSANNDYFDPPETIPEPDWHEIIQ